MTTIACTPVMIASDSSAHDGETQAPIKKLFRLNHHALVGLAGFPSEWPKLLSWLNDDRETQPPKLPHTTALIITGKKIWFYEQNGIYEIIAKWAAIGTGAQAALAAMYMGADPKKAVQIASKIDPNTSGRIRALRTCET